MANTAIIADGFFDVLTDPDEGTAAQGFEDIVSLIKEMPGGTLRRTTSIALASDAFAPIKDYCLHTIDTESAAAADNLATITATGIRDGFWCGIKITSAAKVITVKNSGNITTLDGNDLVIDNTNVEIYFRYDSTLSKWVQQTSPHLIFSLNKAPGFLPGTTLVIASGVVTPIRGVHFISSESGVTDDLDTLTATTLTTDQRILFIKATAGHTITVRDNQGGDGKIRTDTGGNLTLTGNRSLMLWKNGTQWDVIGRLGSWVWSIADGGTNNGSLGVVANGIIAGDGSKLAQVTGTALQQFRVNATEDGIEAFTASSSSAATYIKTADEPITNNATVQDDDHLVAPVLASTTYKFKLVIFFVTAATPDYRFTLTGPAGSTVFFSWQEGSNGGADVAGGTDVTINVTDTNQHMLVITGEIAVAGTAGNLTYRHAQSSSNGTATVTKKGSYMQVGQ